MDAVLFALRRTFWASNTDATRLLSGFELTPARFDMLYAIRQYGDGKIWQSKLRRILGVGASAASEMILALVERGFVTRDREAARDTRQRVVALTRRGRRTILRAIQAFLHDGIARFAVSAFVAGNPGNAVRAEKDRLTLLSALAQARRGLHAGGILDHPAKLTRSPRLASRLFWRREYAYAAGRLSRGPRRTPFS